MKHSSHWNENAATKLGDAVQGGSNENNIKWVF